MPHEDIATRPCPEMLKAGITSAATQSGIDFCINSCPYDHCVVAEPIADGRRTTRIVIKRAALALREKGFTLEAISEALGVPRTTIARYLK